MYQAHLVGRKVYKKFGKTIETVLECNCVTGNGEFVQARSLSFKMKEVQSAISLRRSNSWWDVAV